VTEKNKKENIREELSRAKAIFLHNELSGQIRSLDGVLNLKKVNKVNRINKIAQLRSVPALLIIRQVVFFCPKKL